MQLLGRGGRTPLVFQVARTADGRMRNAPETAGVEAQEFHTVLCLLRGTKMSEKDGVKSPELAGGRTVKEEREVTMIRVP